MFVKWLFENFDFQIKIIVEKKRNNNKEVLKFMSKKIWLLLREEKLMKQFTVLLKENYAKYSVTVYKNERVKINGIDHMDWGKTCRFDKIQKIPKCS